MPVHKGWLPREGLVADPILNFIGKTALNPYVILPLWLLAHYTKKGSDLSILHPTAFSRIKTLFYLGLAKRLSNYFSEKVVNNWVNDKYDWPNEIALVTGGAGGIGGHVVKLLAEGGVKVVVLDIQEELTYEGGPNVHFFKCDITSPTQLAAVAKEVRARVGDPTILVNNAGVARGKTILETSEKDLKFTFDVNTFSHYYTTREFLPAMVARDHGMVVTVASYAAWLSLPNMVDYGSSKAAAVSFHEGLTAELQTRYNAPRVRTVVVNQGYTKTALFTGYQNNSPFLTPNLEVETVADAIVTQIFTGRSGQIILPAFGWLLQLVRGMPHWYAYRLRSKGERALRDFKGRQVVQDLDEYYETREKSGEAEESTVLVPETNES